MYYDRLRNDLFAAVDYPSEVTQTIGRAEPWRAFWQVPIETKNKFEFLNHQADADPGYKLRSRAEGREDKEYFHIYPNMREMIETDNLTSLTKDNPVIDQYFTYSDQVYHASHNFALTIGREMGKEIPELLDLIEGGKIRSVLRMLHYTNSDDAEVIAAQHFDRSLYTLHLYESDPGLQFLNWDMKWTDAPIEEGKTVVFSGFRMEQLTKGQIQKTWHRVVKKGEVRDRVSLVLFVWTHDVPDYERTGRAQDFTPSYVRL